MKKLFYFSVIYCIVSEGAIYPSIPSHLLLCYRGGGPPIGAPRRLDVYLSLLRKLELNSQLNMRMFSAAVLRSLRLDGIEEAANAVETEFVTPYRASSFQFHKYKLLMDLFLPSQNLLEVDEILTLPEKCLLHKMISCTVHHWERGDESSVCPMSAQQRQNVVQRSLNASRAISRCPIEDGVIQSEWGTISPGTLISAIASALEAQRVLVTDILNADVFKADIAEPFMESAKEEWYTNIETLNADKTPSSNADISNIWVATLAGDLAEVVVNQGPRLASAQQRMLIGSVNRWNDTLLPRNYYLFPQNRTFPDWHFTDAEILAGIDGLILANYIPIWVEQRQSLRLSQVIEMYYSNEGVSFNSSVRACNRQSLFLSVFNSSQLLTETSRFANVLFLSQGGVYMPVEEIDRISNAAVRAFVDYLPTIFRQYHKACEISNNVSEMDLIVATDGSWKGDEVEQFISWIGGALQVDSQRSTLALLHGNTGRWIAPPSENLTTTFSFIGNFTDEWPTRLNLPNIISTVIEFSQNKSLQEMCMKASASPSTVVLIVSPQDRPSTSELERARELMSALRKTFFDVYFAYVAKELSDFQNINNEYLDYSELFLAVDSTTMSDIVKTVDTYLVKNDIQTSIIGAHCPVNDSMYEQIAYEDFVLPNREKKYRIHPFYLREQPLISVQFSNGGLGQLLVCMWRGADASHHCQIIPERNDFTFNITTPCPSLDFCLPAHFIVTAISTQNICANNDCRLPNQVGFYLQHSGFRCLPLRGAANGMAYFFKLYLELSLIISILILYN